MVSFETVSPAFSAARTISWRAVARAVSLSQVTSSRRKWFTLAFNQGLEEALTERSKLIKANGMGLDDIIAAKKLVRAFKPNK